MGFRINALKGFFYRVCGAVEGKRMLGLEMGSFRGFNNQ